jgi:hypothetical protein
LARTPCPVSQKNTAFFYWVTKEDAVPDLPAAPRQTHDQLAPPHPPPAAGSRRQVVVEVLAQAVIDLLMAEAEAKESRGTGAVSSY